MDKTYHKKAPSGGPATLYGVLYQILATVDHAAQLHLDAVREGDDLRKATLVVEPSDGGDVLLERDGRRRIEQWKSRRTTRPWSLREFIWAVIPDLYRAACRHGADGSEFVFSTEGRRGKWDRVPNFFKELRRGAVPALEDFDDEEVICTLPNEQFTRRSLMREILNSTRLRHQRVEGRTATGEGDLSLLCELLANLQLAFDKRAEQLVEEIDNLLSDLVDFPEEVPEKRREMCGSILSLGAKGEAKIDPADFMRQHNLQGHPLSTWRDPRDKLRSHLRFQLRQLQYDRSLDVRESPPLGDEKVLLITGESGQGKSWQLYRLAEAFARRRDTLVVLIESSGRAGEDRERLCSTLLSRGFGRGRVTDLWLAVRRIRESAESDPPSLLFCIDRLEVFEVARDHLLAAHQGVGCRFAFAVHPDVATQLNDIHREESIVHRVYDFRLSQLRELLSRASLPWQQIPSDVESTLRRPLLAGLYLKIAEGRAWQPTQEYELYQRYWDRLDKPRGNWRLHLKLRRMADVAWKPRPEVESDSLSAKEPLPLAAGRPTDAISSHTWTPAQLERIGVGAETVHRLAQLGWITTHPRQRISLVHERLLAWCTAQHLVEEVLEGVIEVGDLSRQLHFVLSHANPHQRWRGYVPMDVLWILLDPCDPKVSMATEVLRSLVEEDSRSEPVLFGRLLPTLGPRAHRMILDFILAVGGTRQGRHDLFTGALLETHTPDAAPLILELLQNDDQDQQDVALRVLTAYPDQNALDLIWLVHCERADALSNSKPRDRYYRYEKSFDALVVGVRAHLQWIVDHLTSGSISGEPIWELAYALAATGINAAKPVWLETKERFIRLIPIDHARAVVHCIGAFHDRVEVPRLVRWLHAESHLLRQAIPSVLTKLSPAEAADAVADLDSLDLWWTRGQWLPLLMRGEPNRLRRALLGRLRSDMDDFWSIAAIYGGFQDYLDKETLDLLIQTLARDLAALSRGHLDQLHGRALELLAGCSTREQLNAIGDLQGSSLVSHLVRHALAKLSVYSGEAVSFDLEAIEPLLLKVGGDGIVEYSVAALSHSRKSVRQFVGLKWAPAADGEQVLQALRQLANEIRDAEKYDRHYVRLVIDTLVASGLMQEAIDLVLTHGVDVVSLKTPELRQCEWTIPEPTRGKVLEALQGSDEFGNAAALAALFVAGDSSLLGPVLEHIDRLLGSDGLSLLTRRLIHELVGEETVDEVLEAVPLKVFPEEGALLRLNLDSKQGLLELEARLIEQHTTAGGLGRNDLAFAAGLVRRGRGQSLVNPIWAEVSGRGLEHVYCNPSERDLFLAALQCESEDLNPAIEDFCFRAGSQSYRDDELRLAAVARLSEVDQERAFAAALRTIEQTPDLADAYWLICDIDQVRAANELVQRAGELSLTWQQDDIGRALRGVEVAVVESALLRMLERVEPSFRAGACRLAGWIPGCLSTELSERIRSDASMDVQGEAAGALRRHELLIFAEDIGRCLMEARGSQAWGLLESLIGWADPYLLSSQRDALWIGHWIAEKPGALRVHARSRLSNELRRVGSRRNS